MSTIIKMVVSISFFGTPLINVSSLFLIVLFLAPGLTFSQWPTGPEENLVIGAGLFPDVCPDGSGGAFVTYEVNVAGPRNLRVKRINKYGIMAWPGHIQIAGEYPQQWMSQTITDGSGGILVMYSDEAESGGDPKHITFRLRLKIQRVDNAGSILWNPVGVRISLAEHNQGDYAVASDLSGGCYVSWRDTLNELRMQHIDRFGARAWGDSGILVTTAGVGAPLVSANANAAFVGWANKSFQKYDYTGAPMWNDTGVTLPGLFSRMAADSQGGIVLAGMQYISYNNGDIYWKGVAQRVDATGLPQWGQNGVILEDSLHNIGSNPNKILMLTLQDHITSFAWSKRINSRLTTYFRTVNDSDGSPSLGSISELVMRPSENMEPVALCPSIDGSIICLLSDDWAAGSHQVGQRFSPVEGRVWGDTGVVISVLPLIYQEAVSDQNGGIVIAGFLQADFSIRTQQCSVMVCWVK